MDTSSFKSNTAVDPIKYVPDVWLFYLRDQEHGFEPLRDEIETTVYRLLNPRSLGGFFDGFFESVVQESV